MNSTAWHRPRPFFLALFLALPLLGAGCASVDSVMMTSQQFPPKHSIDEVEVLEQIPACPHIALAQMTMDDSTVDFSEMQHKMLVKGAEIGADAVVFAKPEKSIQHQVAYEPTYSPYGFGGWGYSAYPYGFGYYGGYPSYGGMGMGMGPMGMGGMGGMGGAMAVPYDVTVKSLKGLAIRYINNGGPKC